MGFFRDQIRLSRCVGAKDFDGAIKVLSDGLTNSKDDVLSLEMIAQCHQWAGRSELAIAAAKKALELSPNSFGSFELLSRLHVERAEHETAAHYVKLGLENFPSRIPELPMIFVRLHVSLFRLLSLFSPRFRKVADEGVPDPNRSRDEWYAWAKQYLKWYEDTHGGTVNPRIH